MNRIAAVLALVALVLGVFALGFLAKHDDQRAALKPSATLRTASASRIETSTYVSQVDVTRPDLTVRSARIGASQGSTQAMRDLAHALRNCEDLQQSSEDQLIAREIQGVRSYEAFARDTGRPFDRSQLDAEAEAKAGKKIAARQACAAIPPKDIGQWLAWLERAAAGGDMDAKREFAQAVITSASDAGTALAEADDLPRRKRQAFAFLDDVLKAGDCTVSNQMELLAPNATESYAYAVANFEWGEAMQPQLGTPPDIAAQNTAFMKSELAKKAAKLSPGQVRVASQRGLAIYDTCRR